jgi:hypothetical protein
MSATRVLREAREAGLNLSVSPAGKLFCRGQLGAVQRFKPVLVENRDAIVAELKTECAFVPERLQRAADQRNAKSLDERSTDRWCACGSLATLAWPDGRGRDVWRCLECGPVRGKA